MELNNFSDQTITKDTYLIESFTGGSGIKTIHVEAGVSLTYLVLVKESLDLDLRIESAGEKAEITVKALCIAKKDSDVTLKIHGHLRHNYATADLHMISLLQNESSVEIDGGVDLHKGVHKISGHLLEENIILGDKVKIKTLPMLDVHSSDVSASHGARIERLDEKKLFYMKSRGLDDTQAKELIISGYFEQVFSLFKEGSQEEHKDGVEVIQKEWLDYLLK